MGRRRIHAALILYKTLGYHELGYKLLKNEIFQTNKWYENEFFQTNIILKIQYIGTRKSAYRKGYALN